MSKLDFALNSDREYWLHCYEDHLTKVLGLATASRTSYLHIARRLLTSVSKDNCLDRSMFTASAIMEFVKEDAGPRRGRGPGTTVAGTRSVLRFLISHGVVAANLSTVIPPMSSHRQASLPVHLKDSEVQKALAFSENGTAKGIRNFALVLLFVRLGIRADEATNLRIDDIDWTNGHILIRAGKTRRERKLPLTQDLAEALLKYLKCSRASSKNREIFIQSDPPYKAYRPGSLGKIVTRLLRRAGIQRSSCGPHLFRHTLASKLVNSGATFKEVADVLGHQTLTTTAVYAKLDLVSLSKIALPWPRGGKR